MNNELKGSRIINLTGIDLELARENRNISSTTRIREREIADFCGDCDQHLENNLCNSQAIDSIEQAERTAIGICNLASVDTNQGQMTANGFFVYERKSFREAVLKRFRR